MISWWIEVTLVAVAFAGMLWFLVQLVTAPKIDQDGTLLEDKYGKMGTPFKEGDPLPPEHEGKRYG